MMILLDYKSAGQDDLTKLIRIVHDLITCIG